MKGRTASEVVLLAICVLLFAAATGFVVLNGTAVALHDDLTHAGVADPGFEIELSWLWTQHNEHRIPLPRLVFSWMLQSTRDFRTATVANLWLLALTAFGLALLARRLRGRSSLADAFFPLAFLSFGHQETLLNGFQIAFVIPSVIACALTAAFVASSGLPSTRRIVLVTGLALLLPLCGATGLAQALPIVGWLAWSWSAHRAEGGPHASRASAAAGIGAALITALAAAYLAGLVTEHAQKTLELQAIPTTAAQVLGTWLGEGGRTYWPWSAALSIALVLAGATAGIARSRRDRANRARWYGLLAILLGTVLLALAIGHGRGADPHAGFASRYGALMLAWPSAIFLGAALLPSARGGRAVQGVLCVAAALGWITSVEAGRQGAEARAMAVATIERGVAQGCSYSELADRRPRSGAEGCSDLVRALRQLDRAGVAPFAHARGRDLWLLLGRDPWTGVVRLPPEVLSGAAPTEVRILDRLDGFVVAPGSAIRWSLPDRVTTVRGLCGLVPGSPPAPASGTSAMIAEILDADGAVLASRRIDVEAEALRAVDGAHDFGLYASPASGRTLVLRTASIPPAEGPHVQYFWAEVRVR